ncbi:hypothetical protein F5Y01DRAFT_322529 [Xylaria sp. FL0043]|nr:hypothetical protein F5Y01DRAFT_322529 [Xylaria sp. FL0043]
MRIFRTWFEKNIMGQDSTTVTDTVMVMPFGAAAPKYRDDPNKLPSILGSFSVFYLPAVLQLPLITHCADGLKEYLPIVSSFMGAKSSDLILINLAEEVLKAAKWPTDVKTGREAFETGDNVCNVKRDGTKYGLRPEFWLGNLSLGRQSLTRSDFFELPNLPSRGDNIIHIAIPILGRRTGSSLSTHVPAADRLQAKQKLELWDRQLFHKKKFGSTRLRELDMHNSQFFSIQQWISFSVSIKTSDNWVGIMLLDQGHKVPELQETPWSSYTRNWRAPDFHPILLYNQSPPKYSIPTTSSHEISHSAPNAFHPKDHVRLTSDEELALLRKSPFTVLANVLSRAASAWAQILNFVDSDINQYMSHDPLPLTADALGLGLEQLRFNLDFLSHAQEYLKDNIYLIECRGCRTWPGQKEYEPGTVGAELVSSLLTDYKYLIGRCSDMSRRCETVSQILADTMKVIEARKSLDQTLKITNLTRLAFVFVPLGFICGFFGMNVNVFKNDPPVWIYFAVALPTTGLTFLLLRWKD